ncbi:MAG: CBS domain-containing protein [Erysipelotrichaceae bacterium]|nr:CBS domain-containing protein [Erysipelotrichaceae bacterium]
MEKMNVLLLLTPKKDLAYLEDTMSIRQALEKMRAHSYTQIPVISKEGEYVGTLSEGDLLWYIADKQEYNLLDLQKTNIKQIIRKDFHPAISVNAGINDVIITITKQNFVPVVDDRNILMGIVTRAKVIKELRKSI